MSGDVSVLKPNPRLDGRIVGGIEMDIRDAPWQVTMQTMGRHLCGGSIIGAKWILTAAHCTTSPNVQSNPEKILIKTGTSLHREGAISKVKRIVDHPKYDDSTVDYDFALLELETELELGETRKVIKLADSTNHYSEGSICLVTGWGDTHKSNESTKKLRGTEVPIYPQDKCKKAYRKQGHITERMICAGFQKGGKDGKFSRSISGTVSLFNLFNNQFFPNFYQHVKVILVVRLLFTLAIKHAKLNWWALFHGDTVVLNRTFQEFIHVFNLFVDGFLK